MSVNCVAGFDTTAVVVGSGSVASREGWPEVSSLVAGLAAGYRGCQKSENRSYKTLAEVGTHGFRP